MKAFAVALGLGLQATALWADAAAVMPLRNLDLSLRAEGGPVADVMAAQDLFALSMVRHDPLGAVAAARIMAGVGLSPLARQPVQGAVAAGPQDPMTDAARMFDLARGLALDETLAAVIEVERARLLTPRASTVGLSTGAVAVGARDRWDLAFYAGELAEVAVVGTAGGVLNITVEDAGGQVICLQAGPRDHLYCPFVPLENGVFSVFVGNPDPNPDAKPQGYALLTN